MSKPIIAIDGPAASGKGTLARKMAEALNFAYMDTGILYRAVAFEITSTGLSTRDKKDARDAAQLLVKKLNTSRNPMEILENPALRSDKNGQDASKIAQYPDVREILNKLQRDFAKNPGTGADGAILDGRDIGTVICPNADLKLFIAAKTEIRSQRRLKELQSRGIAATYTSVLDDMRERDSRDISRKDAPMTTAKDAVVIDTSDLTAEQALQTALDIAKKALS